MRCLRLTLLLIAISVMQGAWATDASVRLNFLFNFGRFAEWPDAAAAANTPFTFCLAPGDAEMATEFPTLERQTVQGRPIKAIQISRPAEATRCHVLYLPADLPGKVGPWLSTADRVPILTVSDRPDFIDEGGIIGLVPVAGRYRFDVNLAQAKRTNIFLSANLLKLTRTIR